MTKAQINTVINAASIAFGVSKSKVVADTRKNESVRPRQVVMQYLCYNSKLALNDIAKALGRKNHATVIHAKKIIDGFLEVDKDFRMKYNYFYEMANDKNLPRNIMSHIIS